MDFDKDIRRLSKDFEIAYPRSLYPELMTKQGRPYTCLLLDIHMDFLICIPFRSSIGHNNAYLFKNTKRSRNAKSGLDYTKIVLIDDQKYIDKSPAVVDNDEYIETIHNISKIASAASKYILDYEKHIKGEKPLNKREFDRKYKYSTLPYFHDILRL